MVANPNRIDQGNGNSPWLGLAKFVLILIFAVFVFLLARSMVSHHFFSGGQLNQREARP